MAANPDDLERALREAFTPVRVEVFDDSAAHAGHAGAREGGGHYRVTIVAGAFAGLPRVARHRLVYDALRDWMPREIHALAIDAKSPDESDT